MHPETNDTTTDLLILEDQYVRAESGKRLLNYIIDFVSFYVVFIPLVVGVAMLVPSFAEWIQSDIGLLDNVLSLLCYGIYMGAMEAIFKGKSLGKLLTGTRAINLDGSRISTGKAFARGISRAVLFNIFSALNSPPNPWHDRWNNTMVIDEKKTDSVNPMGSILT